MDLHIGVRFLKAFHRFVYDLKAVGTGHIPVAPCEHTEFQNCFPMLIAVN